MKIVLAILQFILFLCVFFVGSILPAVGLMPMKTIPAGVNRVFVLDGLLMMVFVYLIILGIEAARRRLRSGGGLTTLAFILALVLGLAMKFGFKTP
ncbi:MAG TPA: hypothetical protein VFC39_11310 [Acidobacteriaceae bacterium]|nr:hypothetical protein [Acidobacteriaceae bacterium]